MLRYGLLIAAAVILVDQASKLVMMHWVMEQPQIIPVTGFFNLVTVWNPGVSFGLLHTGSPWMPAILSAVAVAISVVLLFWLRRAETRFVAAAIGMVIGGAIGNVIDRIFYGAVYDFLDFYIGAYHWPAFNIADSAITVGVVLILYDGLFGARKKPI